jgi:hypothetical protein
MSESLVSKGGKFEPTPQKAQAQDLPGGDTTQSRKCELDSY